MERAQAEPAASGARKHLLDVLARASLAELNDAYATLSVKPDISPVRGPETGLIMLRGRIGAGGAPFNLGEATVSRATVRLSTGEIGHGQCLGGDRTKARLIAIFDALAQINDHAALVGGLVASVAEQLESEDKKLAEETAATRVDFFTMVRGDD
jgi:alpha-D-ribose 1-methylphosphonate 5-triphosphate synthase subunit PhnG